jgi:ribosome-associated protein
MNNEQKQQIKDVLDDLKAENICSFEFESEKGEAEEIIIATARSTTHLRATANNVKIEAKRIGLNVIGYEGLDTEWAIVDMAFVVVHIMTQQAREFYKLDKLFDGEELEETKDSEVSD